MKFSATTLIYRENEVIGLTEWFKIKDNNTANFFTMIIPIKMNFNVVEDIFSIESEDKNKIECKYIQGSIYCFEEDFILIKKGTVLYDKDLKNKM